jgi:hypothetical protein
MIDWLDKSPRVERLEKLAAYQAFSDGNGPRGLGISRDLFHIWKIFSREFSILDPKRRTKMSSEPLSNGKAPLCPYKILKGLPNVMPADFVRPDQPSRCTWTKNKAEQKATPHSKRQK